MLAIITDKVQKSQIENAQCGVKCTPPCSNQLLHSNLQQYIREGLLVSRISTSTMNPPPPTTQGGKSECSSDSSWPILINNSTPDPPNMQPVISCSRYPKRSSAVQNHPSSPSQSPVPRLSRQNRRLPNNPVLGHKNIVNTVVQHTNVSR